ncbi:MAG: beta-carotene 15,15'-dioxygenase, Brp/Blh family [Flavobacteriales bacterium]|nr:beta-carotene 15,15'-dioxygenase, Brp/Blh family [Flavobacteriales bacterium]
MNQSLKHIIIGLTIAAYYIFEPASSWYNPVCLVAILLIGVPHGAADHVVNASMQRENGFARYIGKYVLIAAGYAVWWLLSPGKAMIIFLVLTAYHFGQEALEESRVKEPKVWEILLKGSNILVVPLLICSNEMIPLIEMAIDGPFPEIAITTLHGIATIIAIIGFGHLIILRSANRISQKDFYQQALASIITLTTFILLPFFIAFTIYFLLFHSLNAFKHQFDWLKKQKPGYKISSFIKDLSGFSLLSIAGLAFLIYYVQPQGWTQIITYFFMVISILTLPHSMLFDQFYKFRAKKASTE